MMNKVHHLCIPTLKGKDHGAFTRNPTGTFASYRSTSRQNAEHWMYESADAFGLRYIAASAYWPVCTNPSGITAFLGEAMRTV
jgi:hypothetical protein